MSLLHSPGVAICAMLTEMFVNQLATLDSAERIVVIEKFRQAVDQALAAVAACGSSTATHLKSHEEKN